MNWKATLSVGSIVLLPIVLIAVVGVAVYGPIQLLAPQVSDTFLLDAPDLGPGGHTLVPNLDQAVIVAVDRPHDPLESADPTRFEQVTRRRTFTVTTNSLGIRHGELGEKTGTRVLCIGESVGFGWGVKREEAYPARLGNLMGLELINAGTPGMKPRGIALWFAKYRDVFDPDLVLVTARVDWGTREPPKAFRQAIEDIRQTAHPAKVGLIMPPVSAFDPRGRADLDREARIIQEIRGVPVLDLTPVFDRAKPGHGAHFEQQGRVQRIVDRATGGVIAEGVAPPLHPGSPALAPDLVAAFEADPSLAEPLIFDGAHPDAEGFELFAETVAHWIKEEGLLP